MDLPSGFEGIENDKRLCRAVALVHLIVLGALVWQLASFWIVGAEEDWRRWFFAFLAALFLLPGLVLFWRITRFGWVLLLLADVSLLLQVLANLAEGWQTGKVVWVHLLCVSFGVALLGTLFYSRVFKLFTGKYLSYWSRAERRLVRLAGEVLLLGERRTEVLVTDISVTGCSFFSKERLPISERIRFRTHLKEEVVECSIRVIRELAPAEIYLLNCATSDLDCFPFRYGGQFVGSATTDLSRRLLEVESRSENPF